jgi:hypothetical protein
LRSLSIWGKKCSRKIEEEDVYKCLFEKSDLDDRTVSALQHLCTAILPMLQRQFCDQLPGGTLFVPNADLAQNTVLPSIQKSFIPKNEISGFSRSRHKGPVTGLEIISKALHSASNTLLDMEILGQRFS